MNTFSHLYDWRALYKWRVLFGTNTGFGVDHLHMCQSLVLDFAQNNLPNKYSNWPMLPQADGSNAMKISDRPYSKMHWPCGYLYNAKNLENRRVPFPPEVTFHLSCVFFLLVYILWDFYKEIGEEESGLFVWFENVWKNICINISGNDWLYWYIYRNYYKFHMPCICWCLYMFASILFVL